MKHHPEKANDFAAAAVNLLVAALVALTLLGEGLVFALLKVGSPSYDQALMLHLTAIMLPYVLLICGGAFLSGILQVHKRFGIPAAAPIILNACHILVLLIGAHLIHLNRHTAPELVVARQITLSYWLAGVVLLAGCLQVAVLLPALKGVGFGFKFVANFWTPTIRRMLILSIPVALSAGVLQLSVFLDKGISYVLMDHVDAAQHAIRTMTWQGHSFRLPLELGARVGSTWRSSSINFRLAFLPSRWQRPSFPDWPNALDKDRDRFRSVLRHGIEASLWEGLPASLGLILVAEPAARLMFQHGQISDHDAGLIARSTMVYAAAIWAFSLLQIVNRAYYALHDTRTPLIMAVVNILVNLVVEIPLLWRIGESGMAFGTVVSFAIQAVVMLWMLDKKIGGLELGRSMSSIGKMLAATAVMGIICLGLRISPLYPHGHARGVWVIQLFSLLSVGAGVYLGTCWLLGVTMLDDLLPRRRQA